MKRTKSAFNPAFSLAEILVASFIICVLLSCSALCLENEKNKEKKTQCETEAYELASWLSCLITKANMEKADFKLEISEWEADNFELDVFWLTGSQAGKTQMFKSTNFIIRKENASSASRFYSGTWQTLTPALTLSLRHKTKNPSGMFLISVSAVGFASVEEKKFNF